MTERVNAFSKLGKDIDDFLNYFNSENQFHVTLDQSIQRSYHENGWFTKENVFLALSGISSWLKNDILSEFISRYQLSDDNKKIGLIMAGNIPMVGFHDLLMVLLSENSAIVKLSSSDKQLIPVLFNRLVEIDPIFQERVAFVDRLSDFDAVIATGSNNSARYFEQYFSKNPNIIRKNRNSIAVISGNESEEELAEFGKDVFNYYGLGCRNVSKVLIPEDYDLNNLFAAFLSFSSVSDNKKYINNYDYYKALYMLNRADLLENGFFIMKEDSTLFSPVSMLFYQRYQNDKDVQEILEIERENIQCIVSNDPKIKNAVPFGKTQSPAIDDFADGVDTMAFIAQL